MKKISVLALSFIALTATAQNITLSTGSKFTAHNKTTMDMDMGMGGQMKSESSTTSVINITGEDSRNYKADFTITKMKMKGEGLGRDTDYDSDNKADADSEMAKALGSSVNKTSAVLIDKTTGMVVDANPEKPEEDADPMGAMMGGSNTAAVSMAGAFMMIPADKKAGDTWTDSITVNGMKTVRNFQYISLNNGVANVKIKGDIKATIEKEAEGTQITISMVGKTDAVADVEVKTGLVKKNTGTNNIEGTMEVMGQSLPLTMTMTTSSTID